MAAITAWRARAPWSDDAQVEQDLVLAGALVDVFGDATAAGLGWREVAVALASPWYTGEASVTTVALGRLDVDEEAVVRLFRSYLDAQGLAVTRADFEANLAAKLRHPLFLADTGPLLRRDITHDAQSAAVTVRDRLLIRL